MRAQTKTTKLVRRTSSSCHNGGDRGMAALGWDLLRPSRILLAVLVVVCGAYVYLAVLHPRQRVPDHPYFDAPGTWVVAHRGGMALAPENTLEAFRQAEALGVDVLEMDLRFAADGAIVVIHDDTVDRTTNGQGRVGDMVLAELQELDAGYRFIDGSRRFPFRSAGITVPSFSEVLRRFSDIRLNVEMKEFEPGPALALCELLRRFDAVDRVLVSSFPHEPMAAFRAACPKVATGATRREVVSFYLLNRLRLGSLFRSPALTLQVPLRFRGRGLVTPDLLEPAQASNRSVQVWTVNDEAEMRQLVGMGVQGILTDRPDRMLAHP